MAKIERKTQKIFGKDAPNDDIAVFGSFKTGTPIYTDNIEDLQSEAYTKGWNAATAANEAPFLEEMNGVQYVFSKQLAYLFQQGIPEWDVGTTYYLNSYCQLGGIIYKSMLDENINHSPKDDIEGTYWQPFKSDNSSSSGGLEVCDIGISLYIDETKGLRRRLNGQIVAINANTQEFLTRIMRIVALYPSLVCTETEWQAAKTLSAFGQVGKFVFNYATDGVSVESVRLPAVVNVQGLLNLQNLGMTVNAGLPNVTLNLPTSQVYHTVAGGAAHIYTGTQTNEYSLNTQNDWIQGNNIYGNSDTVQIEAIQYPYFIQIATGSEDSINIENEYELNNPFFFGMYQYFEVEPNNASWLKSIGQWNSKAIYTDYYNWILTATNDNTDGFKFNTAEYTDYDFVINTENETFRLPLKVQQKTFGDNIPVIGNGLTLGLTGKKSSTNSAQQYVGLATNDSAGTFTYSGLYGVPNGTLPSVINTVSTGLGVTTDSTKSGLIADLSSASNDKLKLYFYVGDTLQNAKLIDAGAITEALADKIGRQECKAYITETYQNGTSGYRIWSDGYCEQWGILNTATTTVNLLKIYKDTNYIITAAIEGGNTSGLQSTYGWVTSYCGGILSKTASSFEVKGADARTSYPFNWQASGYIA